MPEQTYVCPACGYPNLEEAAWDGDRPSQEVCPCCGLQFGYMDAVGGRDDIRPGFWVGWGTRWFAEGMPWSSPHGPPEGWDPDAQYRAHLARPLAWHGPA
jgi:hypothetical protein